MEIVYFSNVSNNTHRFVEKLDSPAQRIPVRAGDLSLEVDQEFILITPTYGGGREGGAVPKQVIQFLNDPLNRALIRGVVSAGNTNFGSTYCLAGDIISRKCLIPLIHRFEILGTPEDVMTVQTYLQNHSEMEYA
jgi:protein involved in ribonucleotide reduction